MFYLVYLVNRLITYVNIDFAIDDLMGVVNFLRELFGEGRRNLTRIFPDTVND